MIDVGFLFGRVGYRLKLRYIGSVIGDRFGYLLAPTDEAVGVHGIGRFLRVLGDLNGISVIIVIGGIDATRFVAECDGVGQRGLFIQRRVDSIRRDRQDGGYRLAVGRPAQEGVDVLLVGLHGGIGRQSQSRVSA